MSTIPVERFLPESENNRILESVVKETFPNLNTSHQTILHRYMLILIQFIATCFDFYSDVDNFRMKLKQNNYKDYRWLLIYLLPYIDTAQKGYDELTDLNQLYTLEFREMKIEDLPEDIQTIVRGDQQMFDLDPISYRAPNYVFSNIQYSLFDKSGTTYRKIEFNIGHLDQNFKLLLETIKQARNKLHVNWIDIIPIRMDNYRETDLYTNSIAKLKSSEVRLEEWDPIDDFAAEMLPANVDPSNMTWPNTDADFDRVVEPFNAKAAGINIEDLYNTISMDLYESIVQYKWLLFDAVVRLETQPEIVPNVFILKAIFPNFQEMLNGTEYILCDDEIKTEFEKNFRLVFDQYPLKGPVDLSDATIVINQGTMNSLIESFVLFFDQKYRNITRGDSTYKPLDAKALTKENVEDYEQIKSYIEYEDDIKTTLQSMSIPAVYDFISEALQGLKSTWYGTKLLTTDKSDLKDERSGFNDRYGYKKFGKDFGEVVTYKNIYNFCKSLIHKPKVTLNNYNLEQKDPTEVYTRFPKVWSELDDESKEEFTKRINNEYADHLSWFNIYWNIMRPVVAAVPEFANESGVGDRNRKLMKNIYEVLMEEILGISFESMISRGTMTQMIAYLEYTNQELYNMSNKEQKTRLVSKISSRYFSPSSEYMTQCYYYLTNKPYAKTTPHRIDMDDEIQEYDYMKVVSNPSLVFYTATAYNWIAQLGFCHKFINNRINFITAATGAGKSTEVPKLYLYYLKSIDRIDNGTVIVTVPRKNVAEGVSSYISKQMALPYEVYDSEDNKTTSTNYTVQYKHSGSKHIKNGAFPKIRFVTDGSVILDMNNPMLRSVKINKKGNNVYTQRDIYNVVLVDEAHEHNANMDMILSMAKNAVYYNNRFRLGIVSATIEADEPAYRRYYRDVNDNRKYPLSQWIARHNLDRIYIDRRFNISPPDVGTRFPIEEHYEKDGDPVEIVKRIVNDTSTQGDILVFQPGTAEITAVVNALNEESVMPADVIAIPYHARISADRQKIIKDLSKLRMSKKDDFTKVDVYEGTNNYRRMVIVATNIAEASITINSLKYVVETGLEKTARFDYRTRTVVVSPNYITEASRLQRKGRVGRTSAGTVYYTYQKGSMEKNRKQFNISVQDSHLSIYLGQLRDAKDLPIFSPFVNQIVSGRYDGDQSSKGLEEALIASYKQISSSYDEEFIKSLGGLIEELYFSNGKYYPYVGSAYRATSFTEKPRYPYPVYFSGYDVQELTDSRGEFYIIHPDELSIDRNINGDIIGYEADDGLKLQVAADLEQGTPKIQNLVMVSEKIKAFWSTLLDFEYCEIRGSNITKTVMGNIMNYGLSKLTDIRENQDLAKMAIIAYGIMDDKMFDIMLSVLCYLATVDVQPLNAFQPDRYIEQKYAQLEQLYGREMSPSKADILKRVKEVFNPTRNRGYSDMSILIDLIYMMDVMIRRSMSDTFEDSVRRMEMKAEYDDKKSALLQYVSGLSDATGFDDDALDRRDQILDVLLEGHTNSQLEALRSSVDFLRDLGVDDDTFHKYMRLRSNIRQTFKDMVDGVDTFKRRVNIEGFETFADIRDLMREQREIIKDEGIPGINAMLLLGLPYSLVRKIEGTQSHYVSVYAPDLTTMYSIASTSRNYDYPKTFVDSEALTEYVHYMKSNPDLGIIETLTRIEKSHIKLVSHIYSSKNSAPYSINDSDIEKRLTKRRKMRYGENVIPPTVDEGDEFDAINKLDATVQKIKKELGSTLNDQSGSNDTARLTDDILKI